jgi:hypothetical protein
MSNNIGYSSIYPASGAGSAGPVGPIGSTGPAQTIRGATGATGLDSNYITQVVVAEDGTVQLVLSDGTSTSAGILKGATGIYAGLTASSVGGGYPILKGICGGITLDFYNFRTNGLLGFTYDADGTLRFTISANTTAGGISASTENNRIVYVKEKTYIMSTDLIPESTTVANRIGSSHYGYVNFGGETAGRNVVADITDSILSVGPIQRGEKIITLDDFYDVDTDGITLDVSRATVYQITTPIGIKGFKYDTIPTGQIMSVTLVVEGDDIWNFPPDVVFDAESKPIFYPGTNILHMWRTSSDSVWRANFTARGFGVTEVINPGVRGSCCYIDLDETKHCEDYVTQSYCEERLGTFEGLVPCNKNSCIVNSSEKQYDGVCCSEGRCISDIDPNLCQIIGGYFISGITCGEIGLYPDNEAENYSDPESDPDGKKSGLCYNQCKTPTICCRDGECLGHLTEEHCKYLNGTSVKGANSCAEASCCDHIKAPGACCKQDGEEYTCNQVDSPFECNESGGIYMGKNTTCENINCACKPNVCYQCVRNGSTCDCSSIVIEPNESCSDRGYYSDSSCGGQCNSVSCHTCDGTNCVTIQSCGSCQSQGYEDGACVQDQTCQTKTCYANCLNCQCNSKSGIDATLPCSEVEPEYPNESCGCEGGVGGDCEKSAVCFWCFPYLQDNKALSDTPVGFRDPQWLKNLKHNMEAPYRAAFLVDPQLAQQLEAKDIGGFQITTPYGKTYPLQSEILNGEVSISFFDEDWSNMVSPVNSGPQFFETNNDWWSVTGKYRCYFVGAYAYSVSNQQTNKTECLKRFGYEDFPTCKLCDETTPITIPQQFSDPEVYNKIEPYNSIPGPFPPVWGRISRELEVRGCGAGTSADDTWNLRLLSTTQILNLVNETYNGNLKSWLKPILDDETPFSTATNNTGFYKNAAIGLGYATYGFNPALLPIQVNATQKYIGKSIPPDYTDVCLVDGYFEYDPYLVAFPSTSAIVQTQNSYLIYGYSPVGIGSCNCVAATQCDGHSRTNWAYKATGQDSYPVGGPYTKKVQPARNEEELSVFGGDELLSQVGEKYLIKEGFEDLSDFQFPFKYGILGRNLRYNLDAFRTATVFYHTDNGQLVQTMGYSDQTVIPMAWSFWATFEDATCSGGACCTGCVGNACPTCGPNTGTGLGCNAGSGGVLGVGYYGLLVSSAESSSSPGFAPITQLQPKTVKIAEGICVDIMCSDCSSYESC